MDYLMHLLEQVQKAGPSEKPLPFDGGTQCATGRVVGHEPLSVSVRSFYSVLYTEKQKLDELLVSTNEEIARLSIDAGSDTASLVVRLQNLYLVAEREFDSAKRLFWAQVVRENPDVAGVPMLDINEHWQLIVREEAHCGQCASCAARNNGRPQRGRSFVRVHVPVPLPSDASLEEILLEALRGTL